MTSRDDKKFDEYSERFKTKMLSFTTKETPKLPTPSKSVNNMLEGGFAVGKIIELYGHDGSGKSTFALNLLSFLAKLYPNKMMVYFDTEGGLCSKEYLKSLGLDSKNIFILDNVVGDDIFEDIFFLLKKGDAAIIIIDSIATILGEEPDDDSSLGQHARFVSRNLKKFLYYCSVYKSDTVLLLINQLRSKINDMWKGEHMFTTTGGKAMKYLCSLRIELERDSFILDKENRIGFYAKIKVQKSRFSIPFVNCQIPFLYGHGYSKEMEMIDYLISNSILEKRGNWYMFEHKDVKYSFNGKMDLFKNMISNKDIFDMFTLYYK